MLSQYGATKNASRRFAKLMIFHCSRCGGCYPSEASLEDHQKRHRWKDQKKQEKEQGRHYADLHQGKRQPQ